MNPTTTAMIAGRAAWTIAAATLALLLAPGAVAAQTYWQAGTGDWFEPAHWTAGLPTSAIDATIDNGGTAQIASPGAVCRYLNLGSLTGTLGLLNLGESGELQAAYEFIGGSGSGTFTQSGGTNTVSSTLYLGNYSGSSGGYDLSGGELAAGSECIGSRGTGAFIQSGGTNTVSGQLNLGVWAGSSGSYDLSGGELTAAKEYIGTYGAGTFTQSGGTNTVSDTLYLGDQAGSSGSYHLSGAGELVALSERVGSSLSTGTFSQTGGVNLTGRLSVYPGSTYQITGGTLAIFGEADVAGNLDFGDGNGEVLMDGLGKLGDATITRAGSASFTIAADSIVTFPAGFDPTVEFGTFVSEGIYHQKGAPLRINEGQSLTWRGIIDHFVECQGVLNADLGIILNRGVFVSGQGVVELGIGRLYVRDSLSGISGGELTAPRQYVGTSGEATFTQSGGTNRADTELCLGEQAGSHGTYVLEAGTLGSYDQSVGYSGTGTLVQSGGANSPFQLRIGMEPSGFGSYDLSDGELKVGADESVGVYGTGSLTQSGGKNTVSFQLRLGYDRGSSGSYDLSGGELRASEEIIGVSGTGTFTQSGGKNTIVNGLSIGNSGGSLGSYSLSDGELIAANESLGSWEDSAGTFTQSGGTNTVTGYLTLASQSMNSSGTYHLIAGQLSAQYEKVGNRGTGTFTQSGGTNTVDYLYLGCESGASGSYDLSGGELKAEKEYIGQRGSGTFIQSGGTHEVVQSLILGDQIGSGGAYSLSGGQLSASSLTVGRQGTGAFTQTAGTVSIDQVLHIGGTYELNGGTLSAKNVELLGTLLVDGSLTATISVNTLAGSLLGGSGTITAPTVTIGGVLAPGGSLGALPTGANTMISQSSATSQATVPEPGTWALLLVAMVGFAVWRRRLVSPDLA